MGRRCAVCLPNAELSASTNDSGVVAIASSFRVFIAVLPLERSLPPSYAPRVLAFKLSLAAHQNWSSHTHIIAGGDGFLILSHARLRP